MASDENKITPLVAQQLFRSAYWSNLVVIVATGLIYAFYYEIHGLELWLWSGFMCAAAISRMATTAFFTSDQRKQFARHTPDEWIKYYSLSSLATGIGWGALIFFVPVHSSSDGINAIYIIFIGVMSSAISNLPVSFRVYLAYISPIFIAMLSLPVLDKSLETMYLSVAALIYYCFIFITGQLLNRRYRNNFELMIENEALIDKLHDEIIQKQLAENKLIKHQQILEKAVEVRTRELSDINETLVNEINERRRIESNIKHIAHHDALTNLPNRLLLDARLTHAIERAHRTQLQVAVMFIDLDHFKTINDSLGHDIGDKLLVSVSNRLRHCVRENDTVARLGGDEFIIIVEQVHDIADLDPLLKKIMKVTSQPITIGSHELSTSASIGISIFPDDGRNNDQLMRNADAAMYHAKENGRNNYHFYTRELVATSYDRIKLETDLKKAIDRDQIIVYYQPQVSLATREIVSVEALVRWEHHDLGVLSPQQFIFIAEQTGLINEIGEAVLAKACAQIVKWKLAGLPIATVAVNIAGNQIHHTDLVNTVSNVLKNTGCQTEWLELEITEDFLIKKQKQSVDALQKLRDLGISLAIDDFGTGYSSLSYLKQLPINKLKIDQSFVRDISDDMEDAALVQAIIAMGKSLNLKLIAEGVEQSSHEIFLRAHGCEYAQGYYYSKPVPASEIEAMFEARPENTRRKHIKLISKNP